MALIGFCELCDADTPAEQLTFVEAENQLLCSCCINQLVWNLYKKLDEYHYKLDRLTHNS